VSSLLERDIHYRDFPECGGYRNDGELILQADHLITRANAATFADTRLIVCLCRDHHGWKSLGSNARKAEYDALVRTLISPERVKLWDAGVSEVVDVTGSAILPPIASYTTKPPCGAPA